MRRAPPHYFVIILTLFLQPSILKKDKGLCDDRVSREA